ncbi:O-antigen ligase family protein [Campylobacterota bacterium DY0563]
MISINQNIVNIREKINFLLNYLIVFYAFIIPFEYTITKELVKVMFLLWILTFDYERLKLIIKVLKENRVFQSVFLLSSFILLSYLWSDSYPNTVYGDTNFFFKSFIYFYILPIIIIVSSLNTKYIPIIIYSFLISMFINEIISYGIFFEFWSTGIPKSSHFSPVPFQLSGSHITYSVYIAFAILLSIYKLKQIKNRYIYGIFIFFLITMSINLFISIGRTGQFALFLTLCSLLLIYYKHNIKKIILFVCSLLFIFIVAYYNINTFNIRINAGIKDVKNIIYNKEIKNSSVGNRLLSWNAYSYINETKYLLYGVGMGNKEEYVKKRLLETNYPHKNIIDFWKFGRLHNMYLEILVSNGIIGLFLLVMLFYSIFKADIKNKHIKYISYITSLVFTFVAIACDLFFFYEMMLLFGLFLSVVISQSNYEKKESYI